MSRVIVVDGPEKSGKTTLIAALKRRLIADGHRSHERGWGPVKPDDRVYADPLDADISVSRSTVYIWDRCWASEYVYGTLLNRQRRGAGNPWLLEWLHGRAVHGNGLKVMVLPLEIASNAKLRDDTDLPVAPVEEYNLFLYYAQRFGWEIFWNDYRPEWVDETVQLIVDRLQPDSGTSPRFWTYPTKGQEPFYKIIIGEARNKNDYRTMPGAWLPFTSARTCTFVQRYFGDEAFRFVWTNAEDIDLGIVPIPLLYRNIGIYTFGERARQLMRKMHLDTAGEFAHPSFFARWNTDRGRAALAEFEDQYRKVFEL